MDAAKLAKKLNVSASSHALVMNAPDVVRPLIDHLENELGASVDHDVQQDQAYDYVHVYVETAAQASSYLPDALDALAEGGLLWVSYPKKSSKRYASDVSRDSDAWAPLYARDFEAVRQVSVDDDWSALRFRPVKDIANYTRGFARSKAGRKRSGG